MTASALRAEIFAESAAASKRREFAWVPSNGNPLAIAPRPVLSAPLRAVDTRPRAHGRDPCGYCSTRGDLGCAHFAPCEEVEFTRVPPPSLTGEPFVSRDATGDPAQYRKRPHELQREIAEAYRTSTETGDEIARRYGLSIGGLYFILGKFGVPRRRRARA
jgi:hypothetical protein